MFLEQMHTITESFIFRNLNIQRLKKRKHHRHLVVIACKKSLHDPDTWMMCVCIRFTFYMQIAGLNTVLQVAVLYAAEPDKQNKKIPNMYFMSVIVAVIYP